MEYTNPWFRVSEVEVVRQVLGDKLADEWMKFMNMKEVTSCR